VLSPAVIPAPCLGTKLNVVVWPVARSKGLGGCSGKKLVGRDKRSLTELQTKQTVTTIPIRRIYKTNSDMHRATLTAQCPVRSRAATAFPPACSPPPPCNPA